MAIRILIMMLLSSACCSAQLFQSVKEYLFVNDYNMALTAYEKPDAKSKTNDKVIIGKPSMSVLQQDSVCLAPLNFSDDKQVWIVQYETGSCNNNWFYTIRNKATGRYLSVHGQQEVYSANRNLSEIGLVLGPLRKKGSFDIVNEQKWRFGNLDGLFHANGYYNALHYAPFMGRTEMVSIRNYQYKENCYVSSSSYDIYYQHNGSKLGIIEQLFSSGIPPSSDKSKFRVIPNRPVTFITLKNIKEFRCPKVVLKGDREFGGKIVMDLRIELILNPQRNVIYMKVKFRAEEGKGDFSITELNWTEKVYEAPLGTKIKSIVSNPLWHNQFTFNMTEETFNQMPSEFLKFCEVVGDTMGDDISTDDDCNDDTRIGNFVFNKVAVIFE